MRPALGKPDKSNTTSKWNRGS